MKGRNGIPEEGGIKIMRWNGSVEPEGTLNPVFQDYSDILENAGPKLKEIILDRAAHDPQIDLWELRVLVKKAYPEDF